MESKLRFRFVGSARRVLAFLPLALAAGCVWDARLPGQQGESTQSQGAVKAQGVSPLQRPLFTALAGAVEDDDTSLARALLNRLQARPLSEHEESLVDAFRRVIRGREIVAQLELALYSVPLDSQGNVTEGEESGKYRLKLLVESKSDESLLLHLPPADLTRLRLGVTEAGHELSDYDNRVIEALSGLTVDPGARLELDLIDYELPLGKLLAVRQRWQMRARSGEVYATGEAYPAARLRIAPTETIRLREEDAQNPVEPTELAQLFGSEGELEKEVLLEHAVRVPASERDRALRGVAPLIESWALTDPTRIEQATPALRWLSQNTTLGGEGQAWRDYLRGRLEVRRERPVLELPTPRPNAAPVLRDRDDEGSPLPLHLP